MLFFAAAAMSIVPIVRAHVHSGDGAHQAVVAEKAHLTPAIEASVAPRSTRFTSFEASLALGTALVLLASALASARWRRATNGLARHGNAPRRGPPVSPLAVI